MRQRSDTPDRGALRRFWNARLDPLEWNHVGDAGDAPPRASRGSALTAAVEALRPIAAQRILELGCGVEGLASDLRDRGADVTAIDLAERRVAVAQTRFGRQSSGTGSVLTCAADANLLPFRAATFDAIVAQDVLMYNDPSSIQGEAARVLRPGGRLVLVEALRGNPALAWIRNRVDASEHSRYANYLSWSELRGHSDGLRTVKKSAHTLVSLPAWWVLFRLRSVHWHRRLLRLLEPLDRGLLRVAPALGHWAWRGVLVLERVEAPDPARLCR
ncbi:MAG: class I SAM-dependent methyltransferase [Acidobacteriota bacterium]|nr:class I SAM-dependent methyltransferase [Acidobacteriota bacterium]MDH3785037.1 class I SAM-dependent methyltransferase [Acidobacteriota bacterium]